MIEQQELRWSDVGAAVLMAVEGGALEPLEQGLDRKVVIVF